MRAEGRSPCRGIPSFREALTPPVGGCLCAHCHGCMLLLPVVCIVLVFCVDGGFARCFFPLPKGRTVLLLMTSRSCSNSSLRFPFAADVVCCLCCIHDSWGQSVTLEFGSPGSRLSALMPCSSLVMGSAIGVSSLTRHDGDLLVVLCWRPSLLPFPR